MLAAGHEREAVDAATRLRGELDDGGHERRRQVVDHVEAEILEDRRRAGPASARQAGDDHDLGHRDTLLSVGVCEPQIQQPRDRCGVAGTRCTRQEASGGAGSIIRSSTRPCSARVLT
jgi:hypothetical protein